MAKATSAMLADLARSGISKKEVIKALGFKELTPQQVQALTKVEAAGYRIPYYDINGKPNGFYRIRLTDDVARKADPQKKLRYLQPPDTLPHLYFPPLLPWTSIVKDTSRPLIITEGEKKAAAVAQHGLACVGLGGVWSWQARKKGMPVLSELSLIDFKNREVRIVFDSDVMQKDDVQKALNAFSAELERRGAKVLISYLPQDEGKIGLDDFLLSHSPDEISQLETETLASTSVLHKLNEMFFLLEENGEIYNAVTLAKLSKQAASNLSAVHKVLSFTANGGVTDVKAIDAWLEWKQRRMYTAFVYEPGKPRVVDGALNRWRGWGTMPRKGPVTLFHELIAILTPELTPELRKWLLCWLAYPIQNPGAKMATAVLSYGRRQGTGKTLLGLVMQRIYGENSITITQENLYSAYNDWLVEKQFILGEEITGTDSRRHADLLKSLITQTTVTVSKKYEHPYVLRDTANYYLTSNHAKALYLESADRRVFVNHAGSEPADRAFYRKFLDWLDSGGAAAIMHHLLHLDLGEFDAFGKAPMTESKQTMIESSLSKLEYFVDMLCMDPDSVLVDPTTGKPLPHQLFGLNTLLALLDPYAEDNKASPRAMSSLLRHYGFTVKKRLKYRKGGVEIQESVFAIRNQKAWESASWNSWVETYEQTRKILPSILGGSQSSSKIAP